MHFLKIFIMFILQSFNVDKPLQIVHLKLK